jgi:hypothetical protein
MSFNAILKRVKSISTESENENFGLKSKSRIVGRRKFLYEYKKLCFDRLNSYL